MIEKYNYNAVNCWQIFQHPFCKSGEFSFAKNTQSKKEHVIESIYHQIYMVRYSLILMTFL